MSQSLGTHAGLFFASASDLSIDLAFREIRRGLIQCKFFFIKSRRLNTYRLMLNPYLIKQTMRVSVWIHTAEERWKAHVRKASLVSCLAY